MTAQRWVKEESVLRTLRPVDHFDHFAAKFPKKLSKLQIAICKGTYYKDLFQSNNFSTTLLVNANIRSLHCYYRYN